MVDKWAKRLESLPADDPLLQIVAHLAPDQLAAVQAQSQSDPLTRILTRIVFGGQALLAGQERLEQKLAEMRVQLTELAAVRRSHSRRKSIPIVHAELFAKAARDIGLEPELWNKLVAQYLKLTGPQNQTTDAIRMAVKRINKAAANGQAAPRRYGSLRKQTNKSVS
jgi:hypothetical protein